MKIYHVRFESDPGLRVPALQRIFRDSLIGFDSGETLTSRAMEYVVCARAEPDQIVAKLFDATIEPASAPLLRRARLTTSY